MHHVMAQAGASDIDKTGRGPDSKPPAQAGSRWMTIRKSIWGCTIAWKSGDRLNGGGISPETKTGSSRIWPKSKISSVIGSLRRASRPDNPRFLFDPPRFDRCLRRSTPAADLVLRNGSTRPQCRHAHDAGSGRLLHGHS